MKPFIGLLLVSIFSVSAQANDKVYCSFSINSDVVEDRSLKISDERQLFATHPPFKASIRRLPNSLYSIEVYEEGVSRSYAEGLLPTSSASLSWTLWSREHLLSAECRLAE